ncbi:MAG: hypothetical protein ACTSV9_01370 [Candidatus Thorarchaeota archaeon]
MAQTESTESIVSRTPPISAQSSGHISRVAGIGGFLGIAAAGLGIISGTPLLPVPSIGALTLKDPIFYWASTAFVALLVISLLLQLIGSGSLRRRLESGYPAVLLLTFLVGIPLVILIPFGGMNWNLPGQVATYVTNLAILGSIFAILWQLWSIVYVDSSKTYAGLLAGILNAFWIPVLAIGMGLHNYSIANPGLAPFAVAVTTAAYVMLLVGQLMVVKFWWSPITSVREFGRSSDTGKFGFGIAGLLTFIVGTAAIVFGPFTLVGTTITEVWRPWSTMADATTYITDPAFVYALCLSLLFWIMLAPRLGARELRATHIGADVIKGGTKWIMVFFAALGVFAAGQAGTMVLTVAPSYGIFLVVCPALVIFFMGSIYAGKTDVIVGLPLMFAAVSIMVLPYVLSGFIIISWIAILVTQGLLMIETKIRGFTSFSQGFLTVVVSIASSLLFALLIIGGTGAGPAALWPTGKWFNITLYPGIEPSVQAATILMFPMLLLLTRNIVIVGYAHGKKMGMVSILGGFSAIFSLTVPWSAFAVGVVHAANTAAAMVWAFYAITFMLVLSLVLSLAKEVEKSGHEMEGQLLRTIAIVGVLLGVITAIVVLGVFSVFPSISDIASVLTLLVALVVSLEVLLAITWFIAGLRLGMLKNGFKFVSREAAALEA